MAQGAPGIQSFLGASCQQHEVHTGPGPRPSKRSLVPTCPADLQKPCCFAVADLVTTMIRDGTNGSVSLLPLTHVPALSAQEHTVHVVPQCIYRALKQESQTSLLNWLRHLSPAESYCSCVWLWAYIVSAPILPQTLSICEPSSRAREV